MKHWLPTDTQEIRFAYADLPKNLLKMLRLRSGRRRGVGAAGARSSPTVQTRRSTSHGSGVGGGLRWPRCDVFRGLAERLGDTLQRWFAGCATIAATRFVILA